MKLLLLLLVVIAIVIWLNRPKPASRSKTTTGAAAGCTHDMVEAMVQCSHCGLHLPVSESVTGNRGKFFCSEEHRQRYAGS